jgi:hypothetical protein
MTPSTGLLEVEDVVWPPGCALGEHSAAAGTGVGLAVDGSSITGLGDGYLVAVGAHPVDVGDVCGVPLGDSPDCCCLVDRESLVASVDGPLVGVPEVSWVGDAVLGKPVCGVAGAVVAPGIDGVAPGALSGVSITMLPSP